MRSWRDSHDYSGDNDRQECLKCGRILLAKEQNFPPTREWSDKKPVCPTRDNRTLREMLTSHRWMGFLPNAYFYIHVKPFMIQKVTMKDLLAEPA